MYIDASLIDGRIYVSERRKDGKRKINHFLPPYSYFYPDSAGHFKSITGQRLKRFKTNNKREFNRAVEKAEMAGNEIFEHDVNVVYRLLEDKYPGSECPELNISLLDIETDKDPKLGYSRVNNPYSIITAVTIYNNWEDLYYTVLVRPPNLTMTETQDLLLGKIYQDDNGNIVSDCPDGDDFGEMSEDNNFFIVETESELIEIMLELIQDADVLSGWNSEFFDIPYIIQRIRHTMGGETLAKLAAEDGEYNQCDPSDNSIPWLNKLTLFPRLPEMRLLERYGNSEKTYKLFGRIHLDYMALYQKFTFEELHSYALDFVLQKEVNQNKIAYEGSLDQLYRLNIRRFAAYSKQDVAGLKALNDKMRLIQLANTMAHSAGVTLDKSLGSVAIIEQAILRRLHKDKIISWNRKETIKDLPIPGAFVVNPDKGEYKWVCSYDFNSLYPTAIRLINISPEVIIGQVVREKTKRRWLAEFYDDETWYSRPSSEVNGYIIQKDELKKQKHTKVWGGFTGILEYHDIINETDDQITVMLEDNNEVITCSAKAWKDILKENNWSISANGTIFDLSKEGIISTCMTEWYTDRVAAQYKASEFYKKADKEEDPDKKAAYMTEYTYYNMEQHVLKIFLNSTYGAYLNEAFRFYDPRLGSSVTLTGRVMTKHMVRDVSRIMTGNYDFDKRSIIYGDTDSVYATMDWYMSENNIQKTKENAIITADAIGEILNDELPAFLSNAFLIPEKRGTIVNAGREVVAISGLFKDKKKRYALHVINDDGKDVDKLKIMGMETRRSDTPKYIQKFLENVLTMRVKENKSYDEIKKVVEDFRIEFKNIDSWKKGSPGRVSNLTTRVQQMDQYQDDLEEGIYGISKPLIHISVKSCNNTNKLIDLFDEHRLDKIRDGDKVSVMYLKENPHNMDSIAIQVDETYVPDWFQQLPFDERKMEEKLLDKKLFNVIGDILDWDFRPPENTAEEVFEEDGTFFD